jgi:hypothetical protein
VLVRKGKAESVVDPHKPKRPDEEARITRQGGIVLFHGMWRVNGQLAVSRAIGKICFWEIYSFKCFRIEIWSYPRKYSLLDFGNKFYEVDDTKRGCSENLHYQIKSAILCIKTITYSSIKPNQYDWSLIWFYTW